MIRRWLICLVVLGVTQAAFAMSLETTPGLMTGEQAPDFTATTHEGETVTLSELTAQGPVVLVFYRGAWCMYCNLHLRQFQEQLEAFQAQGTTVLGISVDLTEYANQTVVDNKLGFQVISDPNAEILSDYKLMFRVPADLAQTYKAEYGIDLEKHSGRKDYVIAVPATYVVDTDGTIVFAYANKDYQVRTSPQEVLSVLKHLHRDPHEAR